MPRRVLALALVAAACGKRGPALPPLRVEPEPMAELQVLQLGPRLLLAAPLPRKYGDGQGFQLDRVEALVLLREPRAAASPSPAPALAASPTPAAVPPAAVPLAPIAAAAAVRSPFVPGIGDRVPIKIGAAPPGYFPAVGDAAAFAREARAVELVARGQVGSILVAEVAIPPAGKEAQVALRVTGKRGGDRGRTSPLATIAPGPAAPAPGAPRVELEAGGIRVRAPEGAPGAFVLRRLAGTASFLPPPLGGGPLPPEGFLDAEPGRGATACYVAAVRTANPGPGITLSSPSREVCLERVDRFPPEPPGALQVLRSAAGAVLAWRPARAADLKGYLVYRRDAAGTVTRLTAEPLGRPGYTDPQPGPDSEYRVTAVDGEDPPNESAPTAWVRADS